ncbi:transcription factor CPC-like [Castanea sativa]|uniref:transcription factor CPC-like n=1 Tax=Castanea sativa TaxID=21020 RepID=UPI003F64A8CC
MGDLTQTTNDNIEETKEENKQEQDSKLEFSEDEVSLIAKMFRLVGERWSLIAGRIPGRTAEEIEKYWTTKHSSSSER